MKDIEDEAVKPVKRPWNSEKGRWKDKAIAKRDGALGGLKQGENRRKKEELLRLDKGQLLEKGIQSVLDNDEETIAKIMQTLATKAIEGDKQSAAVFLEFSGIKAPKQVEQTIHTPMTEAEADEVLREAGLLDG